MATDFTPPRLLERSWRWLVKSVNHIKPDQLGNVQLVVTDVVPGDPDDGDTIIYNEITNTWILGQTKSKIDNFAVTGTSQATFGLTYPPVRDSWNAELNGARVHSTEFTVAFNQFTVTTPAALFLGADTQGTPWDLEVQYDYLAQATGGFTRLVSEGLNSPLSMPVGVADGDLIVVVLFHVSSQAITDPGYTLVGTTTTSGLSLTYQMDVVAKVRTGGDNTLPTFTDVPARDCIWAVIAMRGASAAVAEMATATGTATGTSPAPPAGRIANLRFWAIISTSNTVVPASGTKILDRTSGAQLNYAAIADDVPDGTLSASLSPVGTAGWAMATVSFS